MKLAELYTESATVEQRLMVIRNDVERYLQATSEDVKKQMNDTLNELTIEYRVLTEEYTCIVNRINDLNSKIKVLGYNMTISQAIEKNRMLSDLYSFYDLMLQGVSDLAFATFDVQSVRRLRDGYFAANGKLANAIQATSWMVEIVPGAPLKETEEADLVNVVHKVAHVENYTKEDTVQAVDEMVDAELETVVAPVEQSKRPRRKATKEVEEPTGAYVVNNTEETAVKEKRLLQSALKEAKETPREKSPSCPIDSSEFSDFAYAVYKVTRDMGRLGEFLESTQDPTLTGVPVRVMQDFINRNFYAENGNVHMPQL